MTVNFTSSPAFRAETPKAQGSETCKCEHPVCAKCNQPIADTYCDEKQEPQKKKGFFSRVKNGFINIRKFFIDFGQLTLGTVKGAFFGALTGSGILAVDGLRNTIKQNVINKQIIKGIAAAKDEAAIHAAKALTEKMPKTLSTKGKVIAGLAAGAVIVYNLTKAKLNANGKKANLDHRWETGHNG